MSYCEDRRRWSDKFIPHIKAIVGPMLLEPTSFEVDTEQAADLIIFQARDMRIAARVRRNQYVQRYPHEFTIRSVSNGNKTELQKIVDGWGDWMFYGFVNADETDFERWYVVDLNAFRADLIRRRKDIRHGKNTNGDGTGFAWFDIRTLSECVILASSHEIESRKESEAA